MQAHSAHPPELSLKGSSCAGTCSTRSIDLELCGTRIHAYKTHRVRYLVDDLRLLYTQRHPIGSQVFVVRLNQPSITHPHEGSWATPRIRLLSWQQLEGS